MSNFICEHCGAEIVEGAGGNYVTGCKHYPLPVKVNKHGAIELCWGARGKGHGVKFIDAIAGSKCKATIEKIYRKG